MLNKTKIKPRKPNIIRVLKGRAFDLTLAIGTTLIISSCNPSTNSVDTAKQDLIKAEESLKIANAEYEAELNNFKSETMKKLEANNQSIADFKARIESQKLEAKEDYIKKVSELEQRNTDLKKKMDDYKADAKENWHSFKSEFNRDMEDLGKSLKNFAVENL